jgi:hypothetical protein
MARRERAPRERPTRGRPDHTQIAVPHLEDGEAIRAAASQVDTGPIHPYLLLLVPILIYAVSYATGLTYLALFAGFGGLAALFIMRKRFTRFVVITDRRLLFFVERLARGPMPGVADEVRRRDLSLHSTKKGALFQRFQFDVQGTPDAGTDDDAGRSLSLRVPRVNQAFIAALDTSVAARPATGSGPRRVATPDPSGRTTPKGTRRRRR